MFGNYKILRARITFEYVHDFLLILITVEKSTVKIQLKKRNKRNVNK